MLTKISKNTYRIEKEGNMKTEVIVYLRPSLREIIEDDSLKQLKDAASLEGAKAVLGMPDIHPGFGIPIGGVLVMDGKDGLISAGSVGMDINCGVRLLKTELFEGELGREKKNQLMQTIAGRIPTGIGTSSPLEQKLSSSVEKITREGVPALSDLGLVQEKDLRHIQDGGNFPGADISVLSNKARNRMHQLGTLGGGNHFIELNRVAEIYEPETAEKFGLEKNQLVIQIHSGSRGFGHQVCVDYSNRMKTKAGEMGIDLPTKGLAAAPINSSLGRDYLKAMAAAANFAYANRQIMTHLVRQSFRDRADISQNSELELLYDISHNLARFEKVKGKQYLIHRKGAVRALPAKHPETPKFYSATGHPILIPGNMGSSSYVAVAGDRMEELYYSVNHGAGRTMSRKQAKKIVDRNKLKETMGEIPIFGAGPDNTRDEAPQAYKNIDEVVETLAELNHTKKVVRLEPLAVIKGD